MAYLGQMNTYENTVPHRIMVTDRILNVDPLKIVPYMRLGTNISDFAFVNMDGVEYRWLEDAYVSETCTVTGLSSGTTTTTFTPSSLTLLQPGDLLLIDSELMWVSAVSSGIPTVTRGYASTTAATHADASTCTRVGRARIDGDDADDSPQTEVTSATNVTQIFQRSVNVARSKQKQSHWGIADPKGYEIDKKMDELMMQLCKLPYYGKRYAGTASAGRTAGGFTQYITTNSTNLSSAALTRDHIDDELQTIHGYGGMTDLILTTAFNQRKINSFYEGFITTERSESTGGNLISVLQNPVTGKMIDVMVDLHCPAGYMYLLESPNIAYYAFDPFFYEDLGKTGDAEKGQIVGEYGFVVRAEKHHSYLYGASTSS